MWESDCSSDSDLLDSSSICYGTKPNLPSKYRLDDNFTKYRDMAAQSVLARLISNPQLRNPEKYPPSGYSGRTKGWNIIPEPPRSPEKATAKKAPKNIFLGDQYMAAVAETQDYLKKMREIEKNSVQAHPSKLLSNSQVQQNQYDEPPTPETKKRSTLPTIVPSSSHHVVQNQKATSKENRMGVAEALRLLENEDWKKKIRGIDTIMSLISFHPETALLRIQELRIAVIQEVTNLRSAVSLAAIRCLDFMFSKLQANMDCSLHQTVRALLQKAGESNTFIHEAVCRALSSMVDNVSPGRALTSLIEEGLSHKNSTVRSTTVKHLAGLLDRMGPEFFLSGKKGITDRVMPAVAKSVQDRCPEARMYGRKILCSLVPHPRLGTMLAKYVPPKDLPAIKLLLFKLITDS